MRPRELGRRAAAVAVAGTVAGGLMFAGAAHAAVYTKESNGVVAQLDTAPGNGSKAWMWGYAPNGVSFGVVEYQFYSGQVGHFDVRAGSARSVNLNTSVWRIRACAVYQVSNGKPPNQGGGYIENWRCSGWS
jgi:hypothetical protein